MEILTSILLIFLIGAIVTYFIDGISRKITGITAFIFSLIGAVVFFAKVQSGDTLKFQLGGIDLQWGLNDYSYYFVYIILGLGVLALLYSIKYMEGKARLGYFYGSFLLTLLGMLGVVISQDFVSLFIFWEIMTWASFLLIIYNAYYKVKTKGIKYMIFSAIGAYAMLTAIVFIKEHYGTFIISEAIEKGAFNFEQYIYIPVFLLLGFGIKAAVMPFHVWAPAAYSKSPMSFTTVFSGAMSKMGVFGIGLVFTSFYLNANPENFYWVKLILGWLGGITAVMGTIYALIQVDAKKLLAYSSIAQLGYIVVGLSTGTKLGVMAALYLAVLHAIFKGALFMVAGAVERQAGTTDMTKVSGLIRKMPWTFFVALISIIALAGIPPIGGFVGKWLLYEALITESNNYILVIVIFFSSTAAFLYSYRFLFGLFLGQEEKETENVKEAPVTMLIPMLILGVLALVTGSYPGLVFEPAAKAMQAIGFTDVSWQMSSLTNIWGNTTNLFLISMLIFAVFIIAFIFLTLKGLKKTRYVGTKEISTSGELPKEWENFTFQHDFFKPFERAAAPLYHMNMNKIWKDLGKNLEAFFGFFRKLYTGNGQTYALYVVIFLVLLLLFKDVIFS
jgi:NADH-quinone oxidoreductase subunit M